MSEQWFLILKALDQAIDAYNSNPSAENAESVAALYVALNDARRGVVEVN